MSDERKYPFHCGTQYYDWCASNCDRCTKGTVGDAPSQCPIAVALSDACFGDGSVPNEIAERMGYLDHSPPRQDGFSYVWQCKEWEPTEEWKAEYMRRHPEAVNAGEP